MPIEDRDYYRERWRTAPKPQGGSARRGGGGHVGTAVSPGAGGSSGGRGWCCFFLLLALIAGGIGVYYWYTSQETESEPTPTPTPTAPAVVGVAPTWTPTPAPASATATSTPFPCAVPTPIPTSTATPDPSATPTPTPTPVPLTEAWQEWMRDWSPKEVNAALAQIIRDFDEAVESLEGLPLREACPLVDDLETRLTAAEDIVAFHRLQDVIVAGEHGGHTWRIWLLNRREVLVATVAAYVPLAECRSLLVTPTPPATATAVPSVVEPTPLPPCPTATPTPPPTATPTATATPRPTPRPRPTATPTPRPAATATAPILNSNATSEQQLTAREIQELRVYALGLINIDRAAYGLPSVVLGLNEAAQLHAEDMLTHDYLGHWWVDGRKPYMVYSQTGGASYASENAAFSGWTDSEWDLSGCDGKVNCIVPAPRGAIERQQWAMMYDDAHADWGHRDNILRRSHRAVNIGIAFNGRRVTFVQHFEGGAVEAHASPTLSREGLLSFSLAKREAAVRIGGVVGVYFDPLPTPKTPTQIGRLDSYCIGGGFTTSCGEPVARILEPPGQGYYYSNLDANEVVADTWNETGDSFSFTVSLGSLATAPGVYTVMVWRDSGGNMLTEQLVELSVTQPAR